jgi:signal transduction histidine kinase
VARHVLAVYAARAADAAVEVDARFDDDLPEVAADRDLLGRAVGNLVKNALEAMPGGGTLRVRAFRRDEAVALAVEDTGPGLDESRRTRLFTPDYTTKEGGTGLGLAIVQGIVSDHGGRVEVTSEPGSGTRFTIVLPAPPSHIEV